MDSMERPHEYISVDEAGFNLPKTRRRGWNIIGQRAIVEVPGQRGGNVTLCAAISPPIAYGCTISDRYGAAISNGVCQQDHQQAVHPVYVVVWDNVSFHRSVRVREWFNINQQFLNVCLPPCSPFLNPIEEFSSAWRWKVYDRNPYTRVHLVFGLW